MVGKFRLEMATLSGERCAREYGFTSFPIDPFTIAHKRNILVEKKPPQVKGVSGALIYSSGSVILLYSTEHSNAGFERFSVGHELGHYFLPGHPEEIKRQGGKHLSRAGFTEGTSSIELEADHFSAGLLMPRELVKKELWKKSIGLEAIEGLADRAEVSLTAAAIQAAKFCEYPICVIVSEGNKVAYAFPSPRFKDLGEGIFLRKGAPLPPNSRTLSFNMDSQNVLGAKRDVAETNIQDWFDVKRKAFLDEEVIGLGRYGFTLTVLSSEDLPIDPSEPDEDDEDDDLERRWTPRFAYGR